MCFACMNVCAWYPQRPEEGARSPEMGITDTWDPPSECWELNLGPLQEQQMLLTAKSSLQPQDMGY